MLLRKVCLPFWWRNVVIGHYVKFQVLLFTLDAFFSFLKFQSHRIIRIIAYHDINFIFPI